jgi:ubiquitin carboxyl-terminal hydrolase 25
LCKSFDCCFLGTSFEKKDMFGQLPLQVDGFKDIHESLEAATAQGEIETLNEGPQSKSCQEVCC